MHHTCSGSYTVRQYCNVKWVQLIYSSLLPVRLFLLESGLSLFISLILARLISWSCGMEYIRLFFVAHMVTWVKNISDPESYMLSNSHSDAGHFRVCYWTEGSPHIGTSQWALFLIPDSLAFHCSVSNTAIPIMLSALLTVVLANNNDMKQVLHRANRAGCIYRIKSYLL